MPRHRTAAKKTKKSQSSKGGDPEAPTESEWRDMDSYGSFILSEAGSTVQYPFKKGNTALILPFGREAKEEIEVHKFWVGKIKEIRARNENDVWVRVQWYYSGRDVSAIVKSFDHRSCGKYERILSDHYDFVSTQCFDGLTTVASFNETDLEQEFIPNDVFYCRYTFEHKIRLIEPKPGEGTCICGKPYSPDDKRTVMHFCPRPGCRRAYHQNCLVKAKSKAPAERELALLVTSPETDDVFSLSDLSPITPSSRKRRRMNNTQSQRGPTAEELLEELPEELVEMAQQPMVRSAAFGAGGVAGNIASVARARRMVYETIAGDQLPDDWVDTFDIDEVLVDVGAGR
ncbi:hypothetical protein BD779DRAFT_1676985 [Infundibulicybe gibba]|nr:hypothetical protein BD779DRAFT_1676985 [Infundibulicybe gibba]